MSEIYDNWERLVAAVLRKEELWALFHAQSRSHSGSSETSSDCTSSSRSCPEIQELARNSDSRDDQMTKEIILLPSQEDRIIGISKFQENKKIIVLKLDKTNQKAMIRASGRSGVEAIAAEIKDKKLTVTGDIDPVALVRSLRKLCHVEIVSVGRLKENSKSSDFNSTTFSFHLEIEERKSSDCSSSSITSYPEIEQLARNSDSRDDHMTGEIVPVSHQTIVLKLDKTNQKAVEKVSGQSVFNRGGGNLIYMKDKKLTATGDVDPMTLVRSARKLKLTATGDIDPVTLVRSLRKLRYVEVETAGRLKENFKSPDFNSSTFSFPLETEEHKFSDFSPNFRSCLEIEELTADVGVRSVDSRNDQTAREVVQIPRQEHRIIRTSTFQKNKKADFCLPFFRGIFQRRNGMTSLYCKVVLILHLADDKTRQKAAEHVLSFSGVESVAVDVNDNKLTVIGEVDPVALVRSLRKLCLTELLLVTKI